ncbi:hypothetical protein QFC20_001573 [Naganishia adeliensis]|uniref:Uncharacterized protein n=1 Tax=Naganishia adeliensis TaxID=92952 RepID=A0ACC2WRN0_9TREE|nr:hypothetical protein QFC20_001573 [Naganishia adeliensis]
MASPTPGTTASPAATTPSSRPVLEHLNSAASPTALTSNDVPSVFETLAADELRDLIQPAFRYVLARHPRYLLRLINRHEEVYAAFLGLVEGYHLHAYNSTFTDHFYGLKFRSITPHLTERQTASKVAVPRPAQYRLSRRQKLIALGCIVGIPYVRSKLQDLYERLGGGLDVDMMSMEGGQDRDNIYRITPRRRIAIFLAKSFKLLYPSLNLAYELMTVGYDISFAFGRTRWWRWWMALVGIEVVRSGAEDADAAGSLVGGLESWLANNQSTSPAIRALVSILKPITKLLSLPSRLPFSINPLASILLSLKFLQWWYSPTSPRLTALKDAEQRSRVDVKPPRMIPPAAKGRSALNLEREKEDDVPVAHDTEVDGDSDSDSDSDDAKSDSSSPHTTPGTPTDAVVDGDLGYRPQAYGTCVICTEEWANPTITPTGYMGCYLCLYGSVAKWGACPVTRVRMRTDELRKVLV